MRIIILYVFFKLFFFNSLTFSQDFKISKWSDTYLGKNQSIIYSLPRTGLTIRINSTKTTIKRGIYAEFAQKYLGLENVPMADSTYWTINGFEIIPFNEPDPEEYYSLTFKTFPANIQSLLSKNNFGIILDLSGKWLQPYQNKLESTNNDSFKDPYLIDETINVHVDTFYKTILNDTSFIRIPVFKKQIITKSREDLIKETAHQLIKTRKNRIKLARGEFDFHPDAATLRIMFDEMKRQENEYLSLFQGTMTENKHSSTYTIFPNKDLSHINLCYFKSEIGIIDQLVSESNTIALQFNKEPIKIATAPLINNNPVLNTLYYKIPNYLSVSIFIGETEKFKSRIPFYQFGTVQGMSLNSK